MFIMLSNNRQFRRMHSQAIAHIDMIWPAAPVWNYPESLCTLFDGDTLHVFGWFDSRPDGGDVCLRQTLAEGQTLQDSFLVSSFG